MSSKSFAVASEIAEYAESMASPEAPILMRLREETQASTPSPNMQIGAEQGRLMAMLARVMDVKRYLEVGVFTGYSSLAVAMALPEDGRIVACDVSEEYTAIARRYWKEAGVEHRIDLRLAPALQTLDGLILGGESFDLAFIDADKPNMPNYYERCLKLVRPNGLILVDNTLWSGRVLEQTDDEETRAIQGLNEALRQDSRVDVLVLPIGDGITMARRR